MKDYTLFVAEWATPKTVAILDDRLNVVPNYVFEKILVTDESENNVRHVVKLNVEAKNKYQLVVVENVDGICNFKINNEEYYLYTDIEALINVMYEDYPTLKFCTDVKKIVQPNNVYGYSLENSESEFVHLIEQPFLKDKQCVFKTKLGVISTELNSELYFVINKSAKDFNIFSFFKHIYRKYSNGMVDYFFDGAVVHQYDQLWLYYFDDGKNVSFLFTFENVVANKYQNFSLMGGIETSALQEPRNNALLTKLEELIIKKLPIGWGEKLAVVFFHKKAFFEDIANINLNGEAADNTKSIPITGKYVTLEIEDAIRKNLKFLYGQNI